MIGINFVGKGTVSGTVYTLPMQGYQSAGVPPYQQSNWNNAEGSSNTTGLALHDADGLATGATVIWTYAGKSYTSVSDATGDGCLMRGYIYRFSSFAPPAITVAGLGPSFTAGGYDVLVYFDGQNATGSASDWVTEYTFTANGKPSISIFGKDAAGANFDGTFTQALGATAADATAGNYVRFRESTASSFTLVGTPFGGDGPINAIQIISAPEPTSLALTVLGTVAALAARPRRSRLRR